MTTAPTGTAPHDVLFTVKMARADRDRLRATVPSSQRSRLTRALLDRVVDEVERRVAAGEDRLAVVTELIESHGPGHCRGREGVA